MLLLLELENYRKYKVFFKEVTEPGPDGEPEKVWLMKGWSVFLLISYRC